VAFVLWYSAVAALGSGRAGLLTGVAPVAAAASGALLGAGAPAVPVWCGVVVVFGGLVIGLRGRPGRPPERPVAAAGGHTVDVADLPPVTVVREPERSASRTGTMDL
jgi:hypothetical protein